jgi:thiamine transporter
MMVSLATVLSIFKLIEMPSGGSVTIASMLPMVILAYRNGIGWGLGSGLVYAAIQQLLGLNDLSYVTGWQSVLAVILLDYIVAFTVVGLGGIFRKVTKSQRNAFVYGTILVSVLRYVCHVISGATVWAGLSIPNEAALIYSIGYNATYMLPEAIILTSVAYYLGGAIDFSRATPTRVVSGHLANGDSSLYLSAGASYLLGCIVDVWLIAPCLQDEETGKFIFSGLKNANWVAVAIVTVFTVAIGTALLLAAKKRKKRT